MKSLVSLTTAALLGACITLLVSSHLQQGEQTVNNHSQEAIDYTEIADMKLAIDNLTQRLQQLEQSPTEETPTMSFVEPNSQSQPIDNRSDSVLKDLLEDNNLDPSLTIEDIKPVLMSGWELRDSLEAELDQSTLASHASLEQLDCDDSQCDLSFLFQDVRTGVKMEQQVMRLLAASAMSCEFELSPINLDDPSALLYRSATIRC